MEHAGAARVTGHVPHAVGILGGSMDPTDRVSIGSCIRKDRYANHTAPITMMVARRSVIFSMQMTPGGHLDAIFVYSRYYFHLSSLLPNLPPNPPANPPTFCMSPSITLPLASSPSSMLPAF